MNKNNFEFNKVEILTFVKIYSPSFKIIKRYSLKTYSGETHLIKYIAVQTT